MQFYHCAEELELWEGPCLMPFHVGRHSIMSLPVGQVQLQRGSGRLLGGWVLVVSRSWKGVASCVCSGLLREQRVI